MLDYLLHIVDETSEMVKTSIINSIYKSCFSALYILNGTSLIMVAALIRSPVRVVFYY